jgi:hypothetical protein
VIEGFRPPFRSVQTLITARPLRTVEKLKTQKTVLYGEGDQDWVLEQLGDESVGFISSLPITPSFLQPTANVLRYLVTGFQLIASCLHPLLNRYKPFFKRN